MTRERLDLLERSSKLCNQYFSLSNQIHTLEKSIAETNKKIIIDPQQAGETAAKKYAEEKAPVNTSNVLLSLLAAMVPYAVLGGLSELIGSGALSSLALAATIGVFIYTYRKLDKKHKAKVAAEAQSKLVAEYEQRNQTLQAEAEELQANLHLLHSQRSNLEKAMADPSACCVPRKYWPVGSHLCNLLINGQAQSIEQAIAQYEEQCRQQQALNEQRKAAEDAARWEELTRMMNSDLAGDLAKKRAAQRQEAEDYMAMAQLEEVLDKLENK